MPAADLPAVPHAPLAAPRAVGSIELVALMASVQALQSLSIDAMLPALGRISASFGVTDPNRRQLVIGTFLLFSGLGSLIPGTLADRYGRRPVLLGVLGTVIVMTIACAAAPSFDALLAFRAIAGFSASGLMVLPMAVLRDRYQGDRMAKQQSTVAMVYMIVPMVAPSLGQAVMLAAGWRGIFGAIAVLGLCIMGWVALRFHETLHADFRQPIEPKLVVRNVGSVFTSRIAFGHVLGMALVQAGLMGFVNSSQQLVAEHFGAGARFPLIFAGMALTMSIASFVNSRIVERFGARRVSQTALFLYLAGGLVQLWLASSGRESLWSFVPVMSVNLCLMGFIGANFAAIALQPFARTAGSAASGQVFVRVIVSAGLAILIGQLYDGTARPLALGLVGAGIGALALVLFAEEGRLFRRLHGPKAQRTA